MEPTASQTSSEATGDTKWIPDIAKIRSALTPTASPGSDYSGWSSETYTALKLPGTPPDYQRPSALPLFLEAIAFAGIARTPRKKPRGDQRGKGLPKTLARTLQTQKVDSDKAAELFHQLEAIVNDHHRDRTCGIPSIGGRSAVKPTASKDYVVRDALVELMTCADVVPSEVCQRMSDLRKQIDALHEYGIDTEPVSRQVPDSSHSKAADLAYRMIAEHFTLEPVFGGWRKETRWRPEEDSTAFNASEERRYANALSSAGILDQQQFWSVVHAWRDIAYKIVEDLAARVRSSPGKLTDETEGRVLLAMLEERDLKLAHRYPEVASWQRLRSHAASKLHSSQGHASIGS